MPEADLALLCAAVDEAAHVALRFTGSKAKRWDKADGAGPVTEADLAVNDRLSDTLRAARPDYGWLSEESTDDASRLSAHRVFVIDPIDGTRSFIEGSGTWAISVAIVEAGNPIAGVVALPARDMVFAASLGLGATLNSDPIHPTTTSSVSGADMLIPGPAMDAEFWPGGLPRVSRHHRPSLAYRLCLVASGRFDAMVTLRDTWEWDIAAGALIASEAGCRVTDRNGGSLVFNSERTKTDGVLIANPALHDALLARRTGLRA
ncbi:MAG: 3'(2'),5'-bisphosphate nucleotidase CysQ [Marinovum sp.]|nr:3'(2'),5'-bisphosphate nucleotidase CysQ [Marinovum sp.]